MDRMSKDWYGPGSGLGKGLGLVGVDYILGKGAFICYL